MIAKKHLTEHFTISGLLLTSYFVVAYTFYAPVWLDKKCDVYFNHTHFKEDHKEIFPKLIESFQTCFNKTFFNTERERNLTQFEKWDCLTKCSQIKAGHANEDGTLNPKASDIFKEQYEKYSNATSSYINKVTSLFTGCAKEAGNTIQSLKANGTDIGECEINGIYDECCFEQFRLQFMVKNNTREICGN